MINRKLNDTPISLGELRVGNILLTRASVVKMYVVTRMDLATATVQLEYSGYDFLNRNIPFGEQVYEVITESVKNLKGIELWDLDRVAKGDLLKEFGFMMVSRSEFHLEVGKYEVVFKDEFGMDDYSTIEIHMGKQFMLHKRLWYLHELQNYCYTATGREIENDLLKKINLQSNNL